MVEPSPRSKVHVDDDGVRTIEAPGVRNSVWLLAVAMIIVGIAAIVVLRPLIVRSPNLPMETSPGPAAEDPSASRHALAAPHDLPPRGARAVAESAQVADRVETPQVRRAAPAPPPKAPANTAAAPTDIDADESANEPSGIAVFPPPGTKPIKRGIIVPDDFELPAGYVRHYQTTDDGRQLPPILMFHPDYQPLDAHGEPVPLPEDRVVPPEMAPAGMPVQTLPDPDKADIGVYGRGAGDQH